ncbi:hypothetical protein Bca101_053152 [Brassica carinata]
MAKATSSLVIPIILVFRRIWDDHVWRLLEPIASIAESSATTIMEILQLPPVIAREEVLNTIDVNVPFLVRLQRI